MASDFTSLPARSPLPSAPLELATPDPIPSSSCSGTVIVRASWNEQPPSKEDLQKYLRKQHFICRTRVEMRLSRRSAFIVCDTQEDAEKIVKVKMAKVAEIKVRFSLVPQSSLDEDYSCSVLVFGVQLPQRVVQEASLVLLIEGALDASLDVVFSRDNGDYDILIISAEMALVFVDKKKKDQLGSLAGRFNHPGITNKCAPHLKAFKISNVPLKYQNKKALCRVFAQWKPEVVLQDDTAFITIANPSAAVMGEVRACCESVAEQAVSIECPAELRENLATDTVTEVEVESLPPDKLAYFGTIRKDPNVSVHVDGGVVSITGPKHSCLEYKKMVETAPLHTLDSTLDPDIVRFLSTTPAKESLTELIKSCQCACFESEAAAAEPKLVIVAQQKEDAISCKDKLKRKYVVVSIDSPSHAILHTDAKDEWECMKGCYRRQTPGVQIILEGNTVKFVGEQKDINVIKEDVLTYISQFSVTDEVIKLSSDGFAVMKHSGKWREVTDLETAQGCRIMPKASDPGSIRVRGSSENVQKILDKIHQLEKSLVSKVVSVDKAGIQKVSLGDNCNLLSTPSSSCSTMITCKHLQVPVTNDGVRPSVAGDGVRPSVADDGVRPSVAGDGVRSPVSGGGIRPVAGGSVRPPVTGGGVRLLSDVLYIVVGGKISSQAADVLFNSTTGDINLGTGQIAQDLAAVAGPTFKRECSQLVKDNGSVPTGGIAVTGAGNLQAQFVIHGNVKTYSSAHPQESIASLRGVVRRALEECDRRRLQSIAFPAIGIGNLSFPPDVAIEALVGSAVNYVTANWSSTSIKKVIFVGFQDTVRTLFQSAVQQQCGLHATSGVPGRSSGGHVPRQSSGGHVPRQSSGGHIPRQSSGGPVPGQSSGGHLPRQSSGGHVPRQSSGGPVPGQSSGGHLPRQSSGEHVPRQSSGGDVPRQGSGGDVRSTSRTVPDYPGLRLPTLQLDPPPKGTPPLGTPLEFSILAESAEHCSQAETDLQQNVDRLLKREEVADETIEQLPTSFMTTFLASAEAAHVQVKIHHNPARVELSGPKEDVEKAMDTLRTSLLMLSNHLQTIDMKISDELHNYQWMYTSGSGGPAKPFSQEECYELEMAHRLKRQTVTLDGVDGRRMTFDMERCTEVTAGATKSMRISRVRKEEGFPRPDSWEGQDNVVEVKKTSQEFKQVATEFERTVGRRVTIVKIERIQNNQLWQAYQANKRVVKEHAATAERMLYHGCPSDKVDSINTNGFTARLAGTSNAVAYGQGIYFARDASYSAEDRYSTRDGNNHKRIYLCCVLTGVYKKGNSRMRVPPAMSAHTTKWCHSTVDNESNPTIFVIYENNMVYPQYLITFTV